MSFEQLSSLSLWDSFLLLLLVIIFLLTVIVQWQNDFTDKIREYDLANFLPAWYFFAPHPVTYNLYLLYRDEYQEGQVTKWNEIPFFTERKWYHFIWNPKKRYNKAFFDLYKSLLDDVEVLEEEELPLSVPYLILLNYVSNLDHSSFAQKTQFSILKKEAGLDETEVVFVSSFHHLN